MQQDDVKREEEPSLPVVSDDLKKWWAFLGSCLVMAFILIFILVIWKPESGFDDKSIWDLLELLIVPLALVFIAFLFNIAQQRREHDIATKQRQQDREIADKERKTDREIARDRNEEEELRAYFDRMAELMLEHELRPQAEQSEQDTAEENDNPTPADAADATNDETAATIARARTLAVLRSIQDPVRKGSVVRFLYESRLIDKEKPVVTLAGADLREADLRGAHLQEANLYKADLRGAYLRWSNLYKVNLCETPLYEADLREAILYETSLHMTILTRADLRGAHLKGAKLYFASMQEANLYGANLQGTHLQGAKLEGTNLEGVQTDEHTNFENARYNNKTILPYKGFTFPASAVNVDER